MTASPAKPPKITRPLLRGSYPRERLFRLLDEARDRPVVWISGPPGCGKTTLISGYVESRRLPCVWYRVDNEDADPATFFHFMNVATRDGSGKTGPHRSAMRPCGSPKAPKLARRCFEELFKRIRSPSVLVLDDWHNARTGSPLDDTVREGLALMPEGMRAVFVSRSDPPPDFVRDVARSRMEHLGWRDLRLTAEETREIARLQRRDPSDELVRYLAGRTGGWAAGVVLLLERAQLDGIEPQRLGRRTPEEIVEYLGGTLFERLDGETRAFLLRSAFLPRMTAKDATALTGHPRAGQLLSHLNRTNLFTELHPGDEPVYEYHALFREFLLHKGEATLATEDACRLRHETARLLEASGSVEDAVDLLKRCGDFDGMCRVIRREAEPLVSQGRTRTLGDWILSLPEGIRDGDPWLLYWRGVCSLAHDSGASRLAFERAFDLFVASGDPAGTLLSWSGAVDAVLGEWNDFTSLDVRIDWLTRRLAEGATFPTLEIEARVSASMAGALFWRRPGDPGIRGWIERSVAASRKAGDKVLHVHSLVHAASLFHWTGDRSAAQHASEEIKALSEASEVPPYFAVIARWLEASTLLWSETNPDAAGRVVSEGLEVSRQSGLSLWDHVLLGAGACGALMKGDEPAARDFLERMGRAIRPGRRFANCQLEHLRAWHHVLQGDPIGATAHAERALEHAEAAGAVFPALLCRIALANVAAGRKDHAAAKGLLPGLHERARAAGSRMLEFMAHLTAARIAFGSGDEAEGTASLRAGMEIGRKQGYMGFFWWWEPAAMTRLCLNALEAGIEPGYAIDIARKRGLSPEVPPMEIEEWPWKIRIYSLGRFGVVRDGKRAEFAGKSQNKPLQLLKALIALGGRDVPREKLSDLLWPEADGDRALQALAVTVRRLRRLLGDERAVLVAEGRLTLSNRVCWVDCWAFKRAFSMGEKTLREAADPGSAESAARRLEKAIGLYRGEFLEEAKEAAWAVPLRERTRSKFLRGVMDAGRIREAAGEWEKALACYRKGLESDDLHEEFYRRIMICHHRLGRPSEALAAYQRCRRTLRAALGVSPSPETEAVLKSVKEGRERPLEPVG